MKLRSPFSLISIAAIAWCLSAVAWLEWQKRDPQVIADHSRAVAIIGWTASEDAELMTPAFLAGRLDGTAARAEQWLVESSASSGLRPAMQKIAQQCRLAADDKGPSQAVALASAMSDKHREWNTTIIAPRLTIDGVLISSILAVLCVLIILFATAPPRAKPEQEPLEVRARSQAKQGTAIAVVGATGLIFGLVNTIGIAAMVLCGIIILSGIMIAGFAQMRVR